MNRRQETDLGAAIVRDPRTWELWLLASGSLPHYNDMPSKIRESELEWRERSLDLVFEDGIADALQAGWVVIPPIMTRRVSQPDFLRPGDGVEVFERRVRVVQPELVRGSGRTDVHVARVMFIVEPQLRPDGRGGEWLPYEPKYGDGSP